MVFFDEFYGFEDEVLVDFEEVCIGGYLKVFFGFLSNGLDMFEGRFVGVEYWSKC